LTNFAGTPKALPDGWCGQGGKLTKGADPQPAQFLQCSRRQRQQGQRQGYQKRLLIGPIDQAHPTRLGLGSGSLRGELAAIPARGRL